MNNFTAPKQLSPFFNCKRIPRKKKKQLNKILPRERYKYLTLNQYLWYSLEFTNKPYRDFLIQEIVK